MPAAGPAMTWPTVRGEADRAFQKGKELDYFGFARGASSAYHQAATLYQSCLDTDSDFAHVTKLDKAYVPPILTESLFQLARLNADALGDYKASVRLYHLAASASKLFDHDAKDLFDDYRPVLGASAMRCLGTALEMVRGTHPLHHLQLAVKAYDKSMKMPKQGEDRHLAAFFMAVALERLGKTESSERMFDSLQRNESPISCWVDSWGYVRHHLRKIPKEDLNLHLGSRDMLKLGVDAAMPLIVSAPNSPPGSSSAAAASAVTSGEESGQGLVCEFGVGTGRSFRMTQELLPLSVRLHGFDTFTGLPHEWGGQRAGSYSTGGWKPRSEGDCAFHIGLFKDTLPRFFEETAGPRDFVAFANIDCKLYSSTMDILENLHDRLVIGSILVFNSYICQPTWRQDGFRAWHEASKRFGWKSKYLGFSLSTHQAVVQITGAY